MRHDEDPLNSIDSDVELDDTLRNELNESVREVKGKLENVKDRIKLKLHLAEMDARDLSSDLLDSLDQVNSRLQTFEHKIDTAVDELDFKAHLGIMEAQEKWDITKKHAQKLVQLLQSDREKARRFLQETKLQGSLAKMDTKVFLAHAKDDMNKGFRQLQQSSIRSLKQFNHSMSDFLHDLGDH